MNQLAIRQFKAIQKLDTNTIKKLEENRNQLTHLKRSRRTDSTIAPKMFWI